VSTQLAGSVKRLRASNARSSGNPLVIPAKAGIQSISQCDIGSKAEVTGFPLSRE